MVLKKSKKNFQLNILWVADDFGTADLEPE